MFCGLWHPDHDALNYPLGWAITLERTDSQVATR